MLRYLSVMLILIGMVKAVLAKLDLLSGQQENVKNALLQLLFVMKIHHGTEAIVSATLVMLLLLENVKSSLHQIQFVTKTQYGMVKEVVSVTPVMWLEFQVDAKNTHHLSLQFHKFLQFQNVLIIVNLME